MTKNKKSIAKKALTVLAATAMVTSVANTPLAVFASEVTPKQVAPKPTTGINTQKSIGINEIGDLIGPQLFVIDTSMTNNRFNSAFVGIGYNPTPNPANGLVLDSIYGNWRYSSTYSYAKFSTPYSLWMNDIVTGVSSANQITEQVINTVPGKLYNFSYSYRFQNTVARATDGVVRATVGVADYGKAAGSFGSKVYTMPTTGFNDGRDTIQFRATSTKTIVHWQLNDGALTNDGSQHVFYFQTPSVREVNEVPNPVVFNKVTNHDNVVTGKAYPNADVVVETNYQESGTSVKRIYDTKANASGDFSVAIPNQLVGSKISGQQTVNGHTSQLAVTNVMDADLYAAPIIDPISSAQTTLTGKATVGATVNVRIGSENFTAPVNTDGTFSVDLKKAYPQGTAITVTLTGPNEKKSNPVNVTVGKSPLELATEAVDNLFTDQTHTGLADGVNQDSIDAAQALVGVLPAGPIKDELQRDIDNAQKLLDEKIKEEQRNKAQEALDKLFTDKTHTALAPETTQESIDAVQELISALPNGSDKDEMQRELDKAQALLDAKIAAAKVKAAEEALEALFKDPTHANLADGVSQADIDAVQKLIDDIPSSEATKKAELQAELDKAKALLKAKQEAENLKAAQDATDALFGDDAHSKLADGVTQDTIDKAKELVNKLPAGLEKDKLLEEIKKAEELLKEQTAIGAPTIAPYTEKDAFVTGTVGRNTSYVGLFVNGVRVKLATPDANGNYRIAATGFALTAGKVFEVRAYGAGNTAGPGTNATVQAATGAEYNLTASDVALDSDYITGEIGSGMNVVKLSVDGTIVKVGQITNGTYRIAVKGLIKAGSVVQVVGYNDRTEVKRVNVKVLTGEKVKLTAMTVQDDVLRGSVEPGSATRVRISINGVATKTATIQADGTFASSIGKQAAGTVIKVDVYEASGYNDARSNTITVGEGNGASTLPTPVINSQDGDYVIGTVTNEAAVVVLYEDGVATRTAATSAMTANPDGTLSFKIYVTKGTKQVQVMARNADRTKVSNLSAAFQIR
ncbi:toxin Cry1Ac domain D-VI-related protein [Listeria booriae]|uniref:toxin Cry1Ac domain D-VI-related protein n=1 Tax=Listeria booriae TaxID=1552123 RepID=UPI0016231AC0|nr:toxin Cry1Ac domain D-VI-related protein [Listeria booriae]MBC2161773.1 hypothetical protein [Listeria booriae]